MVSQKCTYFIGSEQDIKKFKFGGNPEGTVDIYEDRLEFFKKSKGVALMFGAIGSAIEGKGTEDVTIRLDQMRAWREGTTYFVDLTDGRILFMSFLGIGSKAEAAAAMGALLTKIGTSAAAPTFEPTPQPEPTPAPQYETPPVLKKTAPDPAPAPQSEPTPVLKNTMPDPAPAPQYEAPPVELKKPAPDPAPAPRYAAPPVDLKKPASDPAPAPQRQTLQAAPSLEPTVLPQAEPVQAYNPQPQQLSAQPTPVPQVPAQPSGPKSAPAGDSMSFGDAVKQCFSKYATFSGRARRSEYWYFFLFNALVSFVLGLILAPLASVFVLATIVPSIAVSVRRLHDIGKSGVYYLVGLIPLVGVILLIVWFCQDSQPGENMYGPYPKASV